jgi:hypothetical protein
MGFSEGAEDEFLLTCFVCKSPFGMLAMFCGECGCNRNQALGIERASTGQTILDNKPEGTTFKDQATKESVNEIHFQIGEQVTTSPIVPKPIERERKRKSVKSQIRRQNFMLRIESVSKFQERHAQALNLSGTILFLISTYMLVQSFIFAQSNPLTANEDLMVLGANRNPSYFQQMKADEGVKVFPRAYLAWEAADAKSWISEYSFNGWTGKALTKTMPSGSRFEDLSFELQLKATYTKTYGIFRKVTWSPANPPATLTLTYPSNKDTIIYINGLAAGTVGNPAVKEGKYLLYPGPLDIRFYQNGEDSVYSFNYFVNAYGVYSNY